MGQLLGQLLGGNSSTLGNGSGLLGGTPTPGAKAQMGLGGGTTSGGFDMQGFMSMIQQMMGQQQQQPIANQSVAQVPEAGTAKRGGIGTENAIQPLTRSNGFSGNPFLGI